MEHFSNFKGKNKKNIGQIKMNSIIKLLLLLLFSAFFSCKSVAQEIWYDYFFYNSSQLTNNHKGIQTMTFRKLDSSSGISQPDIPLWRESYDTSGQITEKIYYDTLGNETKRTLFAFNNLNKIFEISYVPAGDAPPINYFFSYLSGSEEAKSPDKPSYVIEIDSINKISSIYHSNIKDLWGKTEYINDTLITISFLAGRKKIPESSDTIKLFSNRSISTHINFNEANIAQSHHRCWYDNEGRVEKEQMVTYLNSNRLYYRYKKGDFLPISVVQKQLLDKTNIQRNIAVEYKYYKGASKK